MQPEWKPILLTWCHLSQFNQTLERPPEPGLLKTTLFIYCPFFPTWWEYMENTGTRTKVKCWIIYSRISGQILINWKTIKYPQTGNVTGSDSFTKTSTWITVTLSFCFSSALKNTLTFEATVTSCLASKMLHAWSTCCSGFRPLGKLLCNVAILFEDKMKL